MPMRYDQQDPDDTKTWEVIALGMIAATIVGLLIVVFFRATGRLQ